MSTTRRKGKTGKKEQDSAIDGLSSSNSVVRANPTKGESMRGIVLALRAKISACVITRSREEREEDGDDHYELGTRRTRAEMSLREKRAGFHSPNWPPFPSKSVEPHYYLGTGGNSILIRKLDLYGLTLPQLHLSYV